MVGDQYWAGTQGEMAGAKEVKMRIASRDPAVGAARWPAAAQVVQAGWHGVERGGVLTQVPAFRMRAIQRRFAPLENPGGRGPVAAGVAADVA